MAADVEVEVETKADDEEKKVEDEPKGKVYDRDSEDEPVQKEDDWQAKARKHERDAKKARKEKERLEAALKDKEDENKSEQERAIETAREEARKEAQSEAEAERRKDRLEIAVTRIATKGVPIDDDADHSKRFADAEDALDKVNRRISNGEIDADDIYDNEGKVNTDTLVSALADVARDYPHLLGGEGERPKPRGDVDARKGDAGNKDLEAMTPADHARRKYPDNK